MTSVQLSEMVVRHQHHKKEREQKHFESVYNPDWQRNEKLFTTLRKALQLLPSQHGWCISSDETWKKFISQVIIDLSARGYNMIARWDFDLGIHYQGADENEGKWLNTIHTDCRTDMRLMFDIIEVLEVYGLIVPGEIESMTFTELAVLLSNIFIAMRSAGLGLVRTTMAKPPW